jgi:hypothetical protein
MKMNANAYQPQPQSGRADTIRCAIGPVSAARHGQTLPNKQHLQATPRSRLTPQVTVSAHIRTNGTAASEQEHRRLAGPPAIAVPPCDARAATADEMRGMEPMTSVAVSPSPGNLAASEAPCTAQAAGRAYVRGTLAEAAR